MFNQVNYSLHFKRYATQVGIIPRHGHPKSGCGQTSALGGYKATINHVMRNDKGPAHVHNRHACFSGGVGVMRTGSVALRRLQAKLYAERPHITSPSDTKRRRDFTPPAKSFQGLCISISNRRKKAGGAQ